MMTCLDKSILLAPVEQSNERMVGEETAPEVHQANKMALLRYKEGKSYKLEQNSQMGFTEAFKFQEKL